MNFTLTIKPKKYFQTAVHRGGFDMHKPTAATKESLLMSIDSMAAGGITFSGYASGARTVGTRRDAKDTVYIAYNLEKHRKVVEAVKQDKRKKNQPKRQVVTPGHWVAYVYMIPEAVLKMTGQKLVQGNRTFRLVPIAKA